MANRLELRVPDLSCPGCATTIKKALGQLPGVESVTIDPDLPGVVVAYAPEKISEAEIRKAVTEVGFRVANSE